MKFQQTKAVLPTADVVPFAHGFLHEQHPLPPRSPCACWRATIRLGLAAPSQLNFDPLSRRPRFLPWLVLGLRGGHARLRPPCSVERGSAEAAGAHRSVGVESEPATVHRPAISVLLWLLRSGTQLAWALPSSSLASFRLHPPSSSRLRTFQAGLRGCRP